MATVLYNTGRNAFLTPDATGGQIDWLGNTINAMLINTTTGGAPYVFNAAHKFYTDVSGFANAIVSGAIGTPITLGTKTAVAGLASAAPSVFPAVTNGAIISAIIIYKSLGGTGNTSLLIAYIDGLDIPPFASPLPVTANGGSITLVWATTGTTPGIFKL